jgi:hypothetical protein
MEEADTFSNVNHSSLDILEAEYGRCHGAEYRVRKAKMAMLATRLRRLDAQGLSYDESTADFEDLRTAW